MFNCPYPDANCMWNGSLHNIARHLQSVHHVAKVHDSQKFEHVLSSSDLQSDCAFLSNCYGSEFFFLLRRSPDQSKQYFICQLIGNEQKASHIEVSLKMKTTDRIMPEEFIHRRKPFSLNNGLEYVINNSQCISISADFLHHFIDLFDVLRLTIAIIAFA